MWLQHKAVQSETHSDKLQLPVKLSQTFKKAELWQIQHLRKRLRQEPIHCQKHKLIACKTNNMRKRGIFSPSTSSGLLFSGWDNPEGWGEGGGIYCSTDQANYLKNKNWECIFFTRIYLIFVSSCCAIFIHFAAVHYPKKSSSEGT